MARREDAYTVREVAEILGVPDDSVERMLARGELEGRRQAGGWRIPRRAVDPLAQAEVSESSDTVGPGTETGPAGRGTPVAKLRKHEPEGAASQGPSKAEGEESLSPPVREASVPEGLLETAVTKPPALEAQERRPDGGAAGRRAALTGWGSRALRTGVRARTIDLGELPRGVRVLAILGYAGVAMLLGSAVLLELFGDRMASVRFLSPDAAEAAEVPGVAVVVANLAFVAGWAFVLTGASDCRRRVFLPVALVFVFELFMLAIGLPNRTLIFAMWSLALPLVALPVAAHFFARRLRHWRDYPLLEFGSWSAVVGTFVGFLWIFRKSTGDATVATDGVFMPLVLLGVPFWVFLGFGVAEVATDLARLLGPRLRRMLSERASRSLLLGLLLARPPADFLLLVLHFADAVDGLPMGFLIFDFVVSVSLVVGAVVLRFGRGWTLPSVAALLALVLASPVVSLGMLLASRSSPGFAELAISKVGVSSPVLLFVALSAYNVLSFGVRFANAGGRHAPRAGRVPLYFGVAFLLIGMTIFYANQRSAVTGQLDAEFEGIVEAMFTVGGVSLIPVYLVWTVWRSKERVFDEERASLETRPSGLNDAAIPGGKPGESLAVVGVACSLFGLLFFPPLFGTVGIVLGAVGYVKGSRRLGTVAVVFGAAALVLRRLV